MCMMTNLMSKDNSSHCRVWHLVMIFAEHMWYVVKYFVWSICKPPKSISNPNHANYATISYHHSLHQGMITVRDIQFQLLFCMLCTRQYSSPPRTLNVNYVLLILHEDIVHGCNKHRYHSGQWTWAGCYLTDHCQWCATYCIKSMVVNERLL